MLNNLSPIAMSISSSKCFFNSLGVVTSFFLASSAMAQTNTNLNVLAQKTSSTSPTTNVVPNSTSTPTQPNNLTTSPSVLSPQELKLLAPSSNLLLRPTTTSQVQINVTKSLTLKQAVELGLLNNRDLQAGIIAVQKAKAQLRAAQAAYYPTLNLTSSVNYAKTTGSDIANQSTIYYNQRALAINSNSALQQYNPLIGSDLIATLQLSYSIYDGGTRDANIASAKDQIKYNQLDVERLTEQTRYDVTNAYYTLQNADANVEIAQASVNDATRTLRDAQLLKTAGLGTQYDVLSAEVQLSTAQQSLVQAVAAQKIAGRQLAQVLPVAQDIALTTADPIAQLGDWKFSLEESIVKAYANRVELNQVLVQKNIYKEAADVALALTRPQLSFVTSYSIDDQLQLAQRNYTVPAFFGQGYSIGFQLNWLIYDGGASNAQAQENYQSMKAQDVAFAKERETIREAVEADFYNLQSNKENVGKSRKNVELATEALRLARLRFQAGVGTQTDVINSQTALTTARSQYLQAIIGYNQSYNSIEKDVSKVSNFLANK